jgi:hypothetical protein
MALIVEDGTQVAGANSYVSDAEYVAYASARGKTIASTATLREIELIKSMDYIESHRRQFKGQKVAFDQSLQWPRYSVFIDGFSIDSDAIPDELKNAQMETGIAYNSFEVLSTGSNQNVASEKLDTLEVSYFNGGSWSTPQLETVDVYLEVLLDTSSIGISGLVSRA